MKIALIRPNMGNYRSSDAMTPLAMGILAGRSTGHEVVFYDDRVEPVPERIDADLVAISVETFTARRAYQIADQLRAQGTRVVLGGYHPTLLPQEAAAHADALITAMPKTFGRSSCTTHSATNCKPCMPAPIGTT